MEKAHYHLNKAQEFENKKDFESSISHYYSAAQHFLEAAEYSSDSNVQNTLRKSHVKCINDAKILQKRIIANQNVALETSDSNSSQIEDLAKFSV